MSSQNVSSQQTIYAKASGAGVAGVAVVRISGPGAKCVIEKMTARKAITARVATLCRLRHPETQDALDDALVLWFPAPASFTGEDVVELHLHGGIAVLDGVLAALATLDGFAPAEPGAFSRRAFANNKLDLTQIEGLADLIAAETEAQLKQALAQSEGGLGKIYDGWRDQLVRALALVEAAFDFSDEELPGDITQQAVRTAQQVAQEIKAHLQDARVGERLRSGVRMAIVGPPNAGKSSMMNALARREAAIVSEAAGTTRDIVEVHLNLGGYPLLVADTAGLRGVANDTDDTVEREGVRRARAWAQGADLKLCMFDGAQLPALDSETLALIDDASVVAINRIDLATSDIPNEVEGHAAAALSTKSGDGMDALLEKLASEVAQLCKRQTDAPVPTRERHRLSLNECAAALTRFMDDDARGVDELGAEDLRLAVRALGRITGHVDVEDLLDIIFSEFCIGK